MRDFVQQRTNLLVCSTIIETGIDIPSANTIVIDRADKFGLAQLHQLRGRVGRSHHQAYAYLLTPPDGRALGEREEAPGGDPDDGGARVGLLSRHARPRDPRRRRGARRVAERPDAGDRLQPLQRHARALGAQPARPAASPISRSRSASRPRSTCTSPPCCRPRYCSDVHERLVLYKRLANCDTEDALDGDARGAGRPLRRAARGRAGARREPPPAHPRHPLGVVAHRRAGGARPDPVRAESRDRRGASHRARAAEPRLEARRARPATRAERRADAQGAGSGGEAGARVRSPARAARHRAGGGAYGLLWPTSNPRGAVVTLLAPRTGTPRDECVPKLGT